MFVRGRGEAAYPPRSVRKGGVSNRFPRRGGDRKDDSERVFPESDTEGGGGGGGRPEWDRESG